MQAASSARFVRVVVERGLDAVGAGQGLTYAAPEALGEVRVGYRVVVPLGRGNKPASGIVVAVGGGELVEGVALAKIKAIKALTGVAVPESLLELAVWLSEYYVCPLGMVLTSMMPAAVKRGVGVRTIKLVDRAAAGAESEGAASGGAESKQASSRVTAAVNVSALKPAVRKAWQAIESLPEGTLPLSARDLALQIGSRTIAPINRLIEAGLLRIVERQIVSASRAFDIASLPANDPAVKPTAQQARIIKGVAETLGSFRVHLLRGVTGSGKTEVYLRLVAQVLKRDATAIILVPEIALTPQTSARLLSRFADQGVAVLHSGLTAAQRNQQWSLASSGAARVVIGARSAVFAPVPRLGLIVVDEEHATDYKQDQLPRYHARDVAIKRAQLAGCPVLLCSATPSLESWNHALAGRYSRWELDERLGGGTLPRTEIVDLREDRRERARLRDRGLHLLSLRLEMLLRRTLEEGGQAILLMNRRGFAHYVMCPDPLCGWILECDQCDARLVYHKGASLPRGGLVKCHHCTGERLLPDGCPVCEKKLTLFGGGTQRLEEEIENKFGASRHPLILGETMLRLDSDTMTSAMDYFDALSRFADGRVKVLLGTQVIAKGLDFPNVRLAAVVSADTALWIPDFRAHERAFQLVSQVTGRSGRSTAGGLAIVQTMDPENTAIRLAAAHDYTSFAERELAIRRAAGLPPAMRMARIVVRHKDLAKARLAAGEIAKALRAVPGKVKVTGPMPAPLSRIAGQHRLALELISPNAGELRRVMTELRRAGLLKSDRRTAVDVDPVSLL